MIYHAVLCRLSKKKKKKKIDQCLHKLIMGIVY